MDAGNRILWTVVAVGCVVVGGLGIAASLGALPVDAATTLLPDVVLTRWRGWAPWPWAVLVAVGLLVALAGLLLLRAELRARGGHPLPDLTRADMLTTPRHAPDAAPEPGDPQHAVTTTVGAASGGATPGRTAADGAGPGRTRVRSAALARCVERDLARHPAVRRAVVGLTGDAAAVRLRARLDVGAGTDLHRLRGQLATSIERFTATTGLRPESVRILVRLNDADRVT